ncbi:MAG: class I SAM-dependent methyltransferase, partial [Clostridiales bacterium]|nr:class I SAM-dependent methyltransferase [Clostridiales bacterium]
MIAQLVPRNSRVIDIGTDHGYLPIFLATQKVHQGGSTASIKEDD